MAYVSKNDCVSSENQNTPFAKMHTWRSVLLVFWTRLKMLLKPLAGSRCPAWGLKSHCLYSICAGTKSVKFVDEMPDFLGWPELYDGNSGLRASFKNSSEHEE